MKRTSLADIARHTGFAVSTVSKALRSSAEIPPATRQKIAAASRTLGYYPNPLLAALASKHFGSRSNHGTPLAYIHVPEEDPANETIIRQTIQASQEYARRMGYRLDLFQPGEFKDGVHATRVFFSRGIQGIVLGQQFLSGTLPGMDWTRFSVVGWGESTQESLDPAQTSLHRATVDHYGVVQRAWDETRKRGYRKIGFALLNRSSASMDDRLRWSALQTCLQDLPPRRRIPTFLPQSDENDRFDSRKIVAWVRRHRPEAIIGFNSWFRFLLEKGGYRIPQDFGFVALHIEIDSELHPSAKSIDSGMKHMKFESLLAALELLDQQIRHHQAGLPREPRTLMVRSQWVDGETLPPKHGKTPAKRLASDATSIRSPHP